MLQLQLCFVLVFAGTYLQETTQAQSTAPQLTQLNLYVDSQVGSDWSSGTLDKPLQTLAYAITKLQGQTSINATIYLNPRSTPYILSNATVDGENVSIINFQSYPMTSDSPVIIMKGNASFAQLDLSFMDILIQNDIQNNNGQIYLSSSSLNISYSKISMQEKPQPPENSTSDPALIQALNSTVIFYQSAFNVTLDSKCLIASDSQVVFQNTSISYTSSDGLFTSFNLLASSLDIDGMHFNTDYVKGSTWAIYETAIFQLETSNYTLKNSLYSFSGDCPFRFISGRNISSAVVDNFTITDSVLNSPLFVFSAFDRRSYTTAIFTRIWIENSTFNSWTWQDVESRCTGIICFDSVHQLSFNICDLLVKNIKSVKTLGTQLQQISIVQMTVREADIKIEKVSLINSTVVNYILNFEVLILNQVQVDDIQVFNSTLLASLFRLQKTIDDSESPMNFKNFNITENVFHGASLIDLVKLNSGTDDFIALNRRYSILENLNLERNTFKPLESSVEIPSVITSYNVGLRIINSVFSQNQFEMANLVELKDQMVTVVIANSSFVGPNSQTTSASNLFYKRQMDFNRNPIFDSNHARYVPNFGSFCLLNNTFTGTWRFFDIAPAFDLNVPNFFIHDNQFLGTKFEASVILGVSNIIKMKNVEEPMKILFSADADKKQINDPGLKDSLLLTLFEKAIFQNAQADTNKSISCVFSISGNQFLNMSMKIESFLHISSTLPDTLVDVSNNTFINVTGAKMSRKSDYINLMDFQTSPNIYVSSNILRNSPAGVLFIYIGESSSSRVSILIFNNTLEHNPLAPFIDLDTHAPMELNVSKNIVQNCSVRSSPVVRLEFGEGESHVYLLGNNFSNNTIFTEGFVQVGLIIFEARPETSIPVIFRDNSLFGNSLVSKGINPSSLGYKNSLVYFMNVHSNVTIENSTFLENKAGANMFFVVIYSQTVWIDSLNFASQGSSVKSITKNPKTSLYIATRNLSLTNSTFEKNTVQKGGGFMLDFLFDDEDDELKSSYGAEGNFLEFKQEKSPKNSINMKVLDTTFKNNAVGIGGAIYISYDSITPLFGEIDGNHFLWENFEGKSLIHLTSIMISDLVLSNNKFNCSFSFVTSGNGALLLNSLQRTAGYSPIMIRDSLFHLLSNFAQVVLIDISSVEFPGVVFQNATFSQERNSEHGAFPTTAISTRYSNITMNRVNFLNFSTNVSLIQINEGATVDISESIFNGTSRYQNSVFLLSSQGEGEESFVKLSLVQSLFSNITCADSGACVIKATTHLTKIMIKRTNFTFTQGYSGSIISASMERSETGIHGITEIEESLFYMNSAGSAGIIAQSGGEIRVSNCKFIHNTASARGGAISVSNALRINISNNSFENNSVMREEDPGVGGAIYIRLKPQQMQSLIIASNNFTNNGIRRRDGKVKTAGAGGAIYINLQETLVESSGSKEMRDAILNIPTSNLFSRNYANYGPDFSTTPYSLKFTSLNATDSSVTHSCATSPCQFHVQAWTEIFHENYLRLDLIDLFGQPLQPSLEEELPVRVQSPFKMKLQITNENQTFSELNCSSWNCFMNGNEIKIKGFENQQLNLTFSVTSSQYLPTITFILMTSMRKCQIGELNDTKQLTCTACERGFYSANLEDKVCMTCPDNAICPGGYLMIPKKDYWKPSIYSSNMYECNNTEACDHQTHGEGICAPGYKGPFCLACDLDRGYASSGSRCAKCPPFWQGMLIFCLIQLGIFVVEIGIIWYFSIINKNLIVNNLYSKKSIDRVFRGGYMTIMMDYLQIITILKSYPLLVSGFLTAITQFGSPSQTLFYSSDCVYSQLGFFSENLFYTKLTAVVVFPFIKLGLCASFGIVKKFIYNQYRLSDYIIRALQILVMFEQPGMLSALLSALVCNSADPKAADQNLVEYFLKESPNTECYTTIYYFYRDYIVIPMLAFWGIFLPLILLATLIFNRKKLKTSAFANKFGTQYANYRSEYYFWNLVQLFQKSILIFFAQFSLLPLKMLGLTLLLILIGYMMIINKFQPYKSIDLQKTYIRSLGVFMFTIFAAVYSYETHILDGVTSFLIILVNGTFIAFIGIKMLHLFGFRFITRHLNKLLNKLFSSHDNPKNYFFDESYRDREGSVFHYDHKAGIYLDGPEDRPEDHDPVSSENKYKDITGSTIIHHQGQESYVKL